MNDQIFGDMDQRIKNIYGFTTRKNNKGKHVSVSPAMVLPEHVKKRIDYYGKMMEDGLTFYGAMQIILCYETGKEKEKLMEDFSFAAADDWLEPTEEFIKWRDNYPSRLQEMQIATALMYGFGKQEEVEK